MIICQGCGQAFPIPAGYSRNKIQCPACGVICAVAPGAASAAPPPPSPSPPAARSSLPRAAGRAAEAEAANWLRDPEPAEAVPMADLPEAEVVLQPDEQSAAPPPPSKARDLMFACRRCGRMIRKQRECPICDVDDPGMLPVEPDAPAASRPTPVPAMALASLPVDPDGRAAARPVSLELDDEPPEAQRVDDDFDDEATPYVLADKDHPICPKCSKPMEAGAVMCLACGFNRRTRKKVRRTYQPLDRTWDNGLTLPARVAWFAGFQGLHLMLGLIGAAVGYWKPFVVSWPFLALLSAFLLGTFDRITIRRDAKGRATLIKRWHALFIPLAPKQFEVRGFEGVVTGQWDNPGFWEWVVLWSLLPLGLLPAIVYYLIAINQPYFYVGLAIDHGRPEVYVYRGRSADQMNQISDFLCEAAELRRLG